jgi:hypothetical protein
MLNHSNLLISNIENRPGNRCPSRSSSEPLSKRFKMFIVVQTALSYLSLRFIIRISSAMNRL